MGGWSITPTAIFIVSPKKLSTSGFDYTLNDVGHRLQVTEFDGRVVHYTYDDLYRLTEETINYTYDDLYRLTEETINNGERTIAYTYDNVGNRLTRNDSAEGLTTYTYDDNDRLLTDVLTSEDGTTIHTITHSYDDNGNLISRVQETDGMTETTTYTWNDDDRLVAVTTPEGNSIAYEYDDEGIRVSATVDGETTEFLVDKNRPYAQVLEEFSSDQLQTFYV
ncbi:MAG: RHS repeat protein, partial [Cyanothece sp. SIO2G6]|nr:RHS repeat protein [Cyanothece sp. SIO2G6]